MLRLRNENRLEWVWKVGWVEVWIDEGDERE